MATGASIKAYFGGDTSGLRAAVDDANRMVGGFQNQVSKVIGLKAAMKGLFTGLGISSIQMVVDKLVDSFRKAAEYAKEIADLTGKVADANIALARSRLSDEQKLVLVAQDRARLEREIANNAGKTDEDRKRSLTDQLALTAKIKEEESIRAKINEDASKATDERAKHEMKLQEDLRKVKEEAFKEEVKRQQELADAVDKSVSRADAVNRKLFQQKLESATLDERLIMLERERAEVQAVQSQYAKNTTDWKEQQIELNSLNKSIEQTRLEIAEKTAAAEGKVTKEKQAQTRIGFETATQSIFSDTSDATLREIVRRERERVLKLPANSGNLTELISRAGSQQRLAAAQAELDVRKQTLYNASVGGEERARQLFKGDPMEFDRFYGQLTSGLNKDDKIIETLEKTNNLLAGKFRNQ